MTQGYDYGLGQQIGSLIARQGGASFTPGPLIGQVQDLLGEDTTLLGPLRDLLQRPGFRRLFADGQRSVQISGREALLQDLSSLYHPTVVTRLAAVLDGCLGLPATTATAAPPPPPPPPQAAPQSAPPYSPPPPQSGWAPPYSAPQSAPPPYGASQSAPPPYSTPPQPPYPPNPYPAPAPSGGTNPVTLVLTVVASFLAGAVLLGLGWMLLNARQPAAPTVAAGGQGSGKGSTPLQPAPPAPVQPPSAPPADNKGTSDTATPAGAWGSASEYKFGQLPGGDYPHSCAFSQTTTDGKITTDKSSLEFWACRDVGGNPETGYRVVWADGKETNYTFGPNGEGQVVGTNGSTYPMSWRNDSHKGENIVVINHQDGAISWIPGNITPSGD